MAVDPIEVLCEQAREAISQGNVGRARELYLHGLELRSDSPDVHYGLATVCFLQKDLESAAYHFKEVTRLDPMRAGAHINLGAVLNRLGDYAEAVKYLRQGIQLDPQRAEGYYNLGLVYRNQGETNLAVQAYQEATRINPRMIDAHFNLANLYLQGDHFQKAAQCYRQVLQLRPTWEKAQNGLALAEAGLAGQPAPAAQAAAAGPAEPAAADAEPAELTIDSERLVDPATHGIALTHLYQAAADAEIQDRQLLDVLDKEMDPAIKDLAACLLNLASNPMGIHRSVEAYENAIASLRQAQQQLQTSIARVRTLGDGLLRTGPSGK